MEPDHSLGIPCLKVRRWRRSPTVLPTLWWLGTTPALGLDAREPGGAGGDPRSPESPCSALRRCCPSQENPGWALEAGGQHGGGGGDSAAQASTGWPRCLTAHSTPITASMTMLMTTLPAAPTRKSGSQGQRTGDPWGRFQRSHRSGSGLCG